MIFFQLIFLAIECFGKIDRLGHFTNHHQNVNRSHRRIIERSGSSVGNAVRHDFYMDRLFRMGERLETEHIKSHQKNSKTENDRYHRLMDQAILRTIRNKDIFQSKSYLKKLLKI